MENERILKDNVKMNKIEIFESDITNKNYILKDFLFELVLINFGLSIYQLSTFNANRFFIEYGIVFEIILRILIQLLISFIFGINYFFKKQVTAIRLNVEEGIIVIEYLNLWGTLWQEDFQIDGKVRFVCNPALNNPKGKLVFIFQDLKKTLSKFEIIEKNTGWSRETLESLTIRLMILQRTNEKFFKLKIPLNYNYKRYIEGKINELENSNYNDKEEVTQTNNKDIL